MLGLGLRPRPCWGAYGTPPKPLIGWGVGKLPAQTSPPQRLRHITSSSSATQVQCAPPKTIFWIHPWVSCIEFRVSFAYYSRPSGICRYGRLFYFARVFYFFYLMRNLWNGRKYFGTKYGRTKDLSGKELSVSFTDSRPGVFPGGPKNWAKSTLFRT